jgi:hypothetical protein
VESGCVESGCVAAAPVRDSREQRIALLIRIE